MITAISAADIAFIMSSSTSAWVLSPLECSPQKQNGWTLRFCFWGWIMWKMYNKTIIEFGFRMISWIIIGEHRHSILNHQQLSTTTPVSLHFNQAGHNDVRLFPIELIRSKRDSVRKAREAHLILGFHQSCDQTKNCNHLMNKVKNLGNDRWLVYKQPRQESGLCCFSFACYLQKCVTQIYRALYGNAMFVSFGGTQTWRP